MNPRVSVAMVAYNLADYVEEAIQSVMNQRTSFPIELVIGEDCSTDNTREICRKLADQYSDRIVLLERSANLGMNRNFHETLTACRGEYVAICDADDYWTDPEKLEKQTAFMDANSDYSICACLTQYLRDGVLHPQTDIPPLTTTIKHYAAKGSYFRTVSILFRNRINQAGFFPDAWLQTPNPDFVLNLLNARYGKIMCLPEYMAVYRQHSGGIWSSLDQVQRVRNHLLLLDQLQGVFSPVVNAVLRARKHEWRWQLCARLAKAKQIADAIFVFRELASEPAPTGATGVTAARIEMITNAIQEEPTAVTSDDLLELLEAISTGFPRNCSQIAQSPAGESWDHAALATVAIEELVRTKWAMWGMLYKAVYLMGAGAHTTWLLTQTASTNGPQILAILDDDRKKAGQSMGGLSILTPADVANDVETPIVISSDAGTRTMLERITTSVPNPILLFYDNLPLGPYPKRPTDEKYTEYRRTECR